MIALVLALTSMARGDDPSPIDRAKRNSATPDTQPTDIRVDEPETAARPGPRTLRAEEDWGPFGESGGALEGQRPLDRLKYLPLGADAYLTLGGQARIAYELYVNENLGIVPQDDSGSLVIRHMGHLNLRINDHYRVFAQYKTAAELGRDTGPLAVQQNGFDVHQGFIEAATGTRSSPIRLGMRLGRQELRYGAGRIVDVRDGTANRRSFDAVRGRIRGRRFNVDVLAALEVSLQSGSFDDGVPEDGSPRTRFWGGVAEFAPSDARGFDVYYFGVDQDTLVYAEGSGDELRHSVGARFFQTSGRVRPDIEAIGQWGSFTADGVATPLMIRSYAIEGLVSFRLSESGWRPDLQVGTGYVSGDGQRDDGILGTHRAPFPNLRFAGATSFIGPGNGYGANVRFVVSPNRKSQLQLIYRAFSRASVSDFTYTSFGVPQRASDSQARYVGSSISAFGFIAPHPLASIYATIEYFEPGAYLRSAPPAERSLFATVGTKLEF
ncbi:MAG: alginate export family protein [Myxococcota bacterium]